MEGFVRPPATVLPDGALVPPANLITPPPNHFTHELVRSEPFHYAATWAKGAPPDGELAAGTRVVLLRRDGAACRVADLSGLHVGVACDALRPLG
jgi:hypothetical protein